MNIPSKWLGIACDICPKVWGPNRDLPRTFKDYDSFSQHLSNYHGVVKNARQLEAEEFGHEYYQDSPEHPGLTLKERNDLFLSDLTIRMKRRDIDTHDIRLMSGHARACRCQTLDPELQLWVPSPLEKGHRHE